MNVTITGASGFIGSHLVSHFSERETNVGRYSVRYPLSADTVGPVGDVLVNCAGIAHTTYPDSVLVHQANRDLPVQTAQWAKSSGYTHYVFLSTTLVWDESLELIETERDVPEPNTEYGKAKLAAEKDIMSLTSSSFSVSVIRLPLVYGPGVKGNLVRLIDAVAKWPVCPLGSKEAVRSVTGLSTIGRFIEHVIKNRNQGVFTLIDTPQLTTFDMVRYIKDALPKSGAAIPLPYVTRFVLDRVSPAISTRLLHCRVIVDNSVRETGFDPSVETDVVRRDFGQMARHRYEQIQRKQSS